MEELKYKKETGSIRRASQTGLWGSVCAVIVVAVFIYASPWHFPPQSQYVGRWMLVVGSVMAVLAVSMALLTLRKRMPMLRRLPDLRQKLQGYAACVRSVYLSMFAVVVLLALMAAVGSQSVLLMLAMVATLTLVLAYPNIYKQKVDLGLSDEEMKSLYGERYISNVKDEQ